MIRPSNAFAQCKGRSEFFSIMLTLWNCRYPDPGPCLVTTVEWPRPLRVQYKVFLTAVLSSAGRPITSSALSSSKVKPLSRTGAVLVICQQQLFLFFQQFAQQHVYVYMEMPDGIGDT